MSFINFICLFYLMVISHCLTISKSKQHIPDREGSHEIINDLEDSGPHLRQNYEKRDLFQYKRNDKSRADLDPLLVENTTPGSTTLKGVWHKFRKLFGSVKCDVKTAPPVWTSSSTQDTMEGQVMNNYKKPPDDNRNIFKRDDFEVKFYMGKNSKKSGGLKNFRRKVKASENPRQQLPTASLEKSKFIVTSDVQSLTINPREPRKFPALHLNSLNLLNKSVMKDGDQQVNKKVPALINEMTSTTLSKLKKGENVHKFGTTGDMEAILIKLHDKNAKRMSDKLSNYNEIIEYSVTKAMFDSDLYQQTATQFLKRTTDLNNDNSNNKDSDESYTRSERETLEETLIEKMNTVEYEGKVQGKLNKIYEDLKKRFNYKSVIPTKTPKNSRKTTTKPGAITKMVKGKCKNVCVMNDQQSEPRMDSIKSTNTQKNLKENRSSTMVSKKRPANMKNIADESDVGENRNVNHDFNMLNVFEQVLRNMHKTNVHYFVTTLSDDDNNTKKKKRRVFETNVRQKHGVETKKEIEGIAKKIAYRDYVNGYKHYLEFQKRLNSDNFSDSVKFQAHMHHRVDDIGKFILDKIPQTRGVIEKRSVSEPALTDASEEPKRIDKCWFKKHFNVVAERKEPKRYHSVQSVTFKAPTEERIVPPYSPKSLKNKDATVIETTGEDPEPLDSLSINKIPQVPGEEVPVSFGEAPAIDLQRSLLALTNVIDVNNDRSQLLNQLSSNPNDIGINKIASANNSETQTDGITVRRKKSSKRRNKNFIKNCDVSSVRIRSKEATETDPQDYTLVVKQETSDNLQSSLSNKRKREYPDAKRQQKLSLLDKIKRIFINSNNTESTDMAGSDLEYMGTHEGKFDASKEATEKTGLKLNFEDSIHNISEIMKVKKTYELNDKGYEHWNKISSDKIAKETMTTESRQGTKTITWYAVDADENIGKVDKIKINTEIPQQIKSLSWYEVNSHENVGKLAKGKVTSDNQHQIKNINWEEIEGHENIPKNAKETIDTEGQEEIKSINWDKIDGRENVAKETMSTKNQQDMKSINWDEIENQPMKSINWYDIAKHKNVQDVAKESISTESLHQTKNVDLYEIDIDDTVEKLAMEFMRTERLEPMVDQTSELTIFDYDFKDKDEREEEDYVAVDYTVTDSDANETVLELDYAASGDFFEPYKKATTALTTSALTDFSPILLWPLENTNTNREIESPYKMASTAMTTAPSTDSSPIQISEKARAPKEFVRLDKTTSTTLTTTAPADLSQALSSTPPKENAIPPKEFDVSELLAVIHNVIQGKNKKNYNNCSRIGPNDDHYFTIVSKANASNPNMKQKNVHANTKNNLLPQTMKTTDPTLHSYEVTLPKAKDKNRYHFKNQVTINKLNQDMRKHKILQDQQVDSKKSKPLHVINPVVDRPLTYGTLQSEWTTTAVGYDIEPVTYNSKAIVKYAFLANENKNNQKKIDENAIMENALKTMFKDLASLKKDNDKIRDTLNNYTRKDNIDVVIKSDLETTEMTNKLNARRDRKASDYDYQFTMDNKFAKKRDAKLLSEQELKLDEINIGKAAKKQINVDAKVDINSNNELIENIVTTQNKMDLDAKIDLDNNNNNENLEKIDTTQNKMAVDLKVDYNNNINSERRENNENFSERAILIGIIKSKLTNLANRKTKLYTPELATEANLSAVSNIKLKENFANTMKTPLLTRDYFNDFMIWNGDLLNQDTDNVADFMKRYQSNELNLEYLKAEVDKLDNDGIETSSAASQPNEIYTIFGNKYMTTEKMTFKGRRNTLEGTFEDYESGNNFNKADKSSLKGEKAGVQQMPIYIDTTLLAYDEGDISFVMPSDRTPASPKSHGLTKKISADKRITRPKQYYSTPLPMSQEDFNEFLKANSLDIDSVTSPLHITTRKAEETETVEVVVSTKKLLGDLLDVALSSPVTTTVYKKNMLEDPTVFKAASNDLPANRREPKKVHRNMKNATKTEEDEDPNVIDHPQNVNIPGKEEGFPYEIGYNNKSIEIRPEGKQGGRKGHFSKNVQARLEILHHGGNNKTLNELQRSIANGGKVKAVSAIENREMPLETELQTLTPRVVQRSRELRKVHRLKIPEHRWYKFSSDVSVKTNCTRKKTSKLKSFSVVKWKSSGTTKNYNSQEELLHVLPKVHKVDDIIGRKDVGQNYDPIDLEEDNRELRKCSRSPANIVITKKIPLDFQTQEYDTRKRLEYRDYPVRNKKNHQKHRNQRNAPTFTANNVDGIEVIIEMQKSTQPEKNYALGFMKTFSLFKVDSNSDGKKQQDTTPENKINRVFKAKFSSPVNLEYQIQTMNYATEMTTTVQSTIRTVATDDGKVLSPGVYILVHGDEIEKSNDKRFVLKPILSIPTQGLNIKRLAGAIDNTTGIATTAKVTKNIGKVMLSKDLMVGINEQTAKLLKGDQLARIKKRQADVYLMQTKCHLHTDPLEEKHIGNAKSRTKVQDTEITTKSNFWREIKRKIGIKSPCPCNCKLNRPMCDMCAMTDAVVSELIFEIDNIAKFMEHHCGEIENYFMLNPKGGKKLRATVQNLDKHLKDYNDRLKGKCKYECCNPYITYCDKRCAKHTCSGFFLVDATLVGDAIQSNNSENIKFWKDLQKLYTDLEDLVRLNVTLNKMSINGTDEVTLPYTIDKNILYADIYEFKRKRLMATIRDLLKKKRRVKQECQSVTEYSVDVKISPEITSPRRRNIKRNAYLTGYDTSTLRQKREEPCKDKDSKQKVIRDCVSKVQLKLIKNPETSQTKHNEEKHEAKTEPNASSKDDQDSTKINNFTEKYKTIEQIVDFLVLLEKVLEMNNLTSGFHDLLLNKIILSPIQNSAPVTTANDIKAKEKRVDMTPKIYNDNVTVGKTNANEQTTTKQKNEVPKQSESSPSLEVAKVSIKEPKCTATVLNIIRTIFLKPTNDQPMLSRLETKSVNHIKLRSTENPKSFTTSMQTLKFTKDIKKTTYESREKILTNAKQQKAPKISNFRRILLSILLFEAINLGKDIQRFTVPDEYLPSRISITLETKSTTPMTVATQKRSTIPERIKTETATKKLESNSNTTKVTENPKDFIAKKLINYNPKKATTGDLDKKVINDNPKESTVNYHATKIFNDNAREVTVNYRDMKLLVQTQNLKEGTVDYFDKKILNDHTNEVTMDYLDSKLLDDNPREATVEYPLSDNPKEATIHYLDNKISNDDSKETKIHFLVLKELEKAIRDQERKGARRKDTKVLWKEPSSCPWNIHACGTTFFIPPFKAFSNTKEVNIKDLLDKLSPKQPVAATKSMFDRFVNKLVPRMQEEAKIKYYTSKEKPFSQWVKSHFDWRRKSTVYPVTYAYAGSPKTLKSLVESSTRNMKDSNKYSKKCERPPERYLCDLDATLRHIIECYHTMPSELFEKLVKNITCFRYKELPKTLVIDMRITDKGDGLKRPLRMLRETPKWDWIRNRRDVKDNLDGEADISKAKRIELDPDLSHTRRDTERKEKRSLLPEDGFERLYQWDDGIYRSKLKKGRRKRDFDVELKTNLLTTPNIENIEDTTNHKFAIAGDTVVVECGPSKPSNLLASSSTAPETTWGADRDSMLHYDNALVGKDKIVLRNVQPKNMGVYNCSTGEKLLTSVKVTVLALPKFTFIFVLAYETGKECHYRHLRALQSGLPNAMNDLACSDRKLCSISVEDPVCTIDEATGRAALRGVASMVLAPDSIACSVQCRRDLLCATAKISSDNLQLLASVPVTVFDDTEKKLLHVARKPARRMIVTHTLRRRDSPPQSPDYRRVVSKMAAGDVEVLLTCPAGNRLDAERKVCEACPVDTYAGDGGSECLECPPEHTAQMPGSDRCLPATVAGARYDRSCPRCALWMVPGLVLFVCGCVFLQRKVRKETEDTCARKNKEDKVEGERIPPPLPTIDFEM